MEVQRGFFLLVARLYVSSGGRLGQRDAWLLTGDEFDAHDAFALDVQEVMASEDLLPRAIELADGCAASAVGGAGDVAVGATGAI